MLDYPHSPATPQEHPLITRIRDWLVEDADTIAACAHWAGGTAWAAHAEQLCDAARGGQPLRRRDLRALRDALVLVPAGEAGHLQAALHRALHADDPRAGQCSDVVRSLGWGLAVLGACKAGGSSCVPSTAGEETGEPACPAPAADRKGDRA